ncbi:hypothetical protein ACLI09_14680 [Flavobacterium sp. RHBU_24]|uniref:hypothetical protein n=1 Tax=Flavobacterium sp. RHBU_24 TaxID=3391185 RepID=UPI003984B5AB
MNREDLRVVEFTVIEKSKPKKGKKTVKKEKKKIGLFHLWGTNVNGKGNEKFFGLIEEVSTGYLLEISYKDIRFLNEEELEELADNALAEADALLSEADETIDFLDEVIAEDKASEAEAAPAEETPAEETPAAPKRAPRKK